MGRRGETSVSVDWLSVGFNWHHFPFILSAEGEFTGIRNEVANGLLDPRQRVHVGVCRSVCLCCVSVDVLTNSVIGINSHNLSLSALNLTISRSTCCRKSKLHQFTRGSQKKSVNSFCIWFMWNNFSVQEVEIYIVDLVCKPGTQ